MNEQGSPAPDEEPPITSGDGESSRSRWIVVTSALVVLAVLALMVVMASRFGSDVGYVASAVIDREMPSLELQRLGEDGTLAFDDLRGNIAVINFWASWCTSCRKEHPDLIKTAAAYEPWGVRFVGVSFQDSESAAIAMLDELGWGYEYVVDSDSRAAIAFGVRGVPETYFIDRDGIIRARIYGAATEASLSAQLDALLLEVPGSRGD